MNYLALLCALSVCALNGMKKNTNELSPDRQKLIDALQKGSSQEIPQRIKDRVEELKGAQPNLFSEPQNQTKK